MRYMKLKPNNVDKEGDLSDFEHWMVDDSRQIGLGTSEIADLLGFSPHNYCLGSQKTDCQISSEQQLWGWKCHAYIIVEWVGWLEMKKGNSALNRQS